MATRAIKTTLSIDGESEYKSAISSINSELKTLDSALKLSESEFKGQANTVAALTSKQSALQDIYDKQAQKVREVGNALKNPQGAQQAYADRVETAKTKLASAEAEMQRLKVSTSDTSEQEKQLTQEIDKLNTEINEATRYYQSAGIGVENWQRQLNNAKTDLNNLDYKLQKNSKYMKEAEDSADGCAKSIDEFGKGIRSCAKSTDEFEKGTHGCAKSIDEFGEETEQAEKKTSKFGAIFKGAFWADLASNAISAAVGKIKEFLGSIWQLESETREYRLDLAHLETNAKSTGNGLDKMKDQMFGLVAATGETDSSIEALSNIMQTGFSDAQIVDVVNALRGAVIAFPDTLKIESLADSLQETVATSKGVGQFGELLERSGLNLDEFNKYMGQAKSQSDKLNVAMQYLAKTGMSELNEAYIEENQSALDVAEAEAKLNDAKAELGETIAPLRAKVLELGASFIENLAAGSDTAAEAMQNLQDCLSETDNTQALIDKYRSLSTEISNSTLSASELESKTAELEQVKQDLIKVSGGVVTAIGIENGSFDTQVGTLEKLNQSQRDYIAYKLETKAFENSGAEAIKNKAAAQAKYNDTYDNLLKAEETEKALRDKITSGDKGNIWSGDNEAHLEEATSLVEYYRKSLGEAASEMEEVSKASNEGENAIKQLVEGGFLTADEACSKFGITADELNSILNGTSDATQSTIPEIQTMSEQIDALNAEYEAAYNSALESLNGQVGMWDNMSNSAVTSVEEMQEALDSQISWFENYNTNLETVMTLDIPDVDMQPLLDSISDGTPEAAARAAALAEAVNNGDTEMVKKLAQTVSTVGSSKEELATTMAEATTNYDERYQEIVETTAKSVKDMDKSKEAKQSGIDTIQGYINGANRKSGALYATMSRIAQQTLATWKREMDSHSPSRKMIKEGENAVEGVIIGVGNLQAELKSAYAEMGKTLLGGLSVGMKDGSGKLMETTDDVAKELLSRFKDIGNVLSTSGDISDLKYDLWEMTGGENATADDKANKEIESLTEQSVLQQKQIEATRTAYKKMVDLYGENGEESLKLQKQLLQEKIAYEKLQQSIEEVNKAKNAPVETSKLADMAEDEFKLWFKETPDATETEKLEKQSEVLTFKLGLQSDAVSDTEKALKDAARQYGKNSEESIKIQEQLLKEKIAYQDLRLEIQELNSARGQYGSFDSSASSSGFLQSARIFESINNRKINTDISAINSLNKPDIGGMIETAVNAVGTITGTQKPIVVEAPIYFNDKEVARAITPALRDYDASNPQARSDRI